MIEVAILSTGSDGNCYILTTDHPFDPNAPKSIMIDCGVTNTAKKCAELGIDLNDISAICITHAHTDHVASLKTVLNKMPKQCPICGTYEELHAPVTLKHLPDSHEEILIEFEGLNETAEMMRLGNFAVIPILADHDRDKPVHYYVSDGRNSVFVSCDNCKITPRILEFMRECDCVMLESNYSERAFETDMIDGKEVSVVYDMTLKNRIACKAHTSNRAAKAIIDSLRGYVKKVILIHPSKFYNSYKTMVNEISPDDYSPDMRVRIADKKHCPFQERVK